MIKKRTAVLAFLLLIALFFTTFLLFTRGFLLTRLQTETVSSCNPPPLALSNKDSSNENKYKEASYSCWVPRRFKKAVVIMIDALRYDFAVWNPLFSKLPKSKQLQKESQFYTNHLTSMHNALIKTPNNAMFVKFVADSPTVTMQRLKGLTTGSFPTFFDVRSNFESEAISEDNLIDQLRRENRDVVMMGDDTWEMLFPGRFKRSYPYLSFNVKDIHTVDNGVLKHLIPELKGTRGKWDVLIAHFLGVDHVGHTFGPVHPAMTAKLEQMDRTLTDVMNVLDNDTILFVMGDHGMTPEGNHGGAEPEEVNTALFMYSKSGLNNIYDDSISVAADSTKEVPQIYLVPTMSLLLGVPIPHGSLGALIPDLFLYWDNPNTEHNCEDREIAYSRLSAALRSNAAQVYQYLGEYGGLNKAHVGKLSRRVEVICSAHDALVTMSPSACAAAKEHKRLSEEFLVLLSDASQLCLEAWTKFDVPDMTWGILFGFVTCLGVIPFLLVAESYNSCPNPTTLWQSGCFRFVLGVVIGWVIPAKVIPWPGSSASIGMILLLVPSTSIFGFIDWSNISRQFFRGCSDTRSQFYVIMVVFALHGVSLFSNSFIVAEGLVIHFLTATVLLVWTFSILRRHIGISSHGVKRIIVVGVIGLGANRIGFVTTMGIDVQQACLADHESDRLEGFMRFAIWTETVIPVLLLAILGTLLLNKMRAGIESRFGYLLFIVTWIVSILSCFLHWILQCIGHGITVLPWPYLLPRLAFIFSFICIGMVVLATMSVWREGKGNVGVIVYCSLKLTMSLLAPILIALGPMAPRTLLLLFVQAASFVYILSQSRPKDSPLVASSLNISSAVWWGMLCLQAFHDSGHRAQFNGLHISAAFALSDQYSIYLNGTLMVLNAFWPYLLGAVSFPLLLWHADGSMGAPLSNSIFVLPLALVWRSGVQALLTSCFVFFARRHLMVHAIFAPKYLFDAVSLIVTGCSAVLVTVLYLPMCLGDGNRETKKE